jgi:hypothetical protein
VNVEGPVELVLTKIKPEYELKFEVHLWQLRTFMGLAKIPE